MAETGTGTHTKKRSRPINEGPRITREKTTIASMISIYCKGQGHVTDRQSGEGRKPLCPQCEALLAYAGKRLELCRFGEDKTTCQRCPVHCYKPEQREQIKQVMRYAGPRMIWSHPVMALRHLAGKG